MSASDEAADWRSQGACLSADPDLFFPISPGGASQRQVRRAKAVCATCPVQAECLAFAVETRQVHGVWGGLGEEELARLRRSLRPPGAAPEQIPGTGRVPGRGQVAGARYAAGRDPGTGGTGSPDRRPDYARPLASHCAQRRVRSAPLGPSEGTASTFAVASSGRGGTRCGTAGQASSLSRILASP
jgi:WhiB family transcriptional regulator, redox-sensing transcriptional regulator